LRQFYSILSGGLANDALLNNTIKHFKDFDDKNHLVPLIQYKFGKAFWDFSLVLQDKNGTFTIVTPIINTENKVTALLFGSARNKDYSYFRLIDRNTPQSHLTEYGDKKATMFTKATLYGIFNILESNWKRAIQILSNTSKDMHIGTMGNSSSISELYVASIQSCWDYSYTYVEAGYNSTTVIIRQCQSNAMYIDNGSGNSGNSGLGLPHQL